MIQRHSTSRVAVDETRRRLDKIKVKTKKLITGEKSTEIS